MYITLIIPAHNEAQRLPATLRRYVGALAQRYGVQRFEVLVVANGCTDNTVAVAVEQARRLPQVRVITIPEAVGKGGALLEGFRQARGQALVFADADGATAPDSLLELLDGLGQHDLVIGSRRMAGSQIGRRQPLRRRAAGTLFAASVRACFGMGYRDTQCGAKALRAAAALQLAGLVQERRWMFDVDLLLCARGLGLSVDERPVVWSDVAGSKLRIARTAWEVLGALRRLRARHSARPALAWGLPADAEVR